MNVIRMLFLAMAVLLPTSWTLANAGDDMKDGSGGEMKKGKKKKGDMGGERRHGQGQEKGGHGEEVGPRSIASAPAGEGPGRRIAHKTKGARALERRQPPTSPGRPHHPLGERDRADHHDRQRAAHLQCLPGVRAQGRHVLLLPVRRPRDPRVADVRRLAGGGAQLALRDDVGAGGERSRVPGFHLPARRVAGSGSAARDRPRRLADDEVLSRAAPRPSGAGQTQCAPAAGVFFDADPGDHLGRCRGSRSGSRCSSGR